MQEYQEHRFQAQVRSALATVRTLLENERQPHLPSEVPHQYIDKYLLAEFLTNTSFAALLNALQLLGISNAVLHTLIDWAKQRSVTLRFTAEERCEFVREETRKEESKDQRVVENTFLGKFTHKTVTTITEYFWVRKIKPESRERGTN
jgi:hypothetical protein